MKNLKITNFKKINSETLILFPQFTIKTLDELAIVSNQNLSIEMFLVRLMHLSSFKEKDDNFVKNNFSSTNENYSISEFKKDTISQMKSVSQEKE